MAHKPKNRIDSIKKAYRSERRLLYEQFNVYVCTLFAMPLNMCPVILRSLASVLFDVPRS